MPGHTPVLQLPYPQPPDPADVPADVKALADRIEALYGAPNGLPTLGADGKVPAAQLPLPKTTVSAWGNAPPANPAEGDIWLAPIGTATWEFRYRPGSSGAYPWEFVGGAPHILPQATYGGVQLSAWTPFNGAAWATARPGEYLVDGSWSMYAPASSFLTGIMTAYSGSAYNSAPYTGQVTGNGTNYYTVLCPQTLVTAPNTTTTTALAYWMGAAPTQWYHVLFRVIPKRVG